MISVENFYWVLFENLLRPTGLDSWYYFPFGTKDNLSRNEFKDLRCRYDYNHVFFHFEQEPIWNDRLGLYDLDGKTWSNEFARILANSEQSLVKDQLCKSRNFIDWYFFYHGYAALDWYQDAQYIRQEYQIKNAFLSLNHIFHGRSYRASLLARLIDKDICHKGSISFHATVEDILDELHKPDTDLSIISQALIKKHLHILSAMTWRLDDVQIDGNLSARFGHQEYKLHQSSLVHLVNETVFYEPKLHLTEKVFKPITAQRPFLLVAAPGNLKYLRSYGFKTFSPWIDESYDNILDPDQRLDAITKEVERFAQMSRADLQNIYSNMLPVLEYNKQHFFGQFRKIIVDELVDNFDRCIRLWNIGQVRGRELPLHPDLESVKQTLLR